MVLDKIELKPQSEVALSWPRIVSNYQTPKCRGPTSANASWEEVERKKKS